METAANQTADRLSKVSMERDKGPKRLRAHDERRKRQVLRLIRITGLLLNIFILFFHLHENKNELKVSRQKKKRVDCAAADLAAASLLMN